MVTCFRFFAVAMLILWGGIAAAQEREPEKVHFPSLDGTEEQPATQLDAYLLRPAMEGRRPAVVFLHGCGGLFARSGAIIERETDWARRLNALGYAVLMVDSFTPRGRSNMCSPERFDLATYLKRPKDAYGALRWLQEQPFVKPERIAVIGWSQGGGTVLFGVREASLGRPAELPHGDFRAAIAFYPAACTDRAHKLPWNGVVPLLVLAGEKDVWTPTPPCRSLVAGAAARGAPVEIHVYSGAFHDFDWPGLAVRELPAFRTESGIVPIVGMDPEARADALERVPAFLARHLAD